MNYNTASRKLHLIDDSFDPNPSTVRGSKDLVEMFWVLKKVPLPPLHYPDKSPTPTAQNKKTPWV